jgi:hypothetical protein
MTTSILSSTSFNLRPTSVTLLSTVWVRCRICAAAIRASSCVNVSNLFNASSMSFLPTSFLRNFSVYRLAYTHELQGNNALARLCFISFVAIAKIFKTSTIIFTMISVIASVGGTSVYRFEPFEEVLDALEEIGKRFFTRVNILGSLTDIGVKILPKGD